MLKADPKTASFGPMLRCGLGWHQNRRFQDRI
jgi:hypothetical protein